MNRSEIIYLDNAASSWPKPEGVEHAMKHFMSQVGANPGRSGHELSITAGRILYETREKIACLFNEEDPLRVVFTGNATESINCVLFGYLRPGDHVITTGMEHNSMMRPLRMLENNGVEITVLPCNGSGYLYPPDICRAFRKKTVLIAINHGSNVSGTLQSLREIGVISREKGSLLLVDAAQTAGSVPIDMKADGIDLLAFTGHKGLYGPQGTGGLVIGERVPLDRLDPLKYGGTGSRSEFEIQPDFLPDKYESGTPNTVGIAGLGAGVDFVLRIGVDVIHRYEKVLFRSMLEGLMEIDDIIVYWSGDEEKQLSTFSFNSKSISPNDLGFRLNSEFGIMTRVGLHCCPAAHRTLGTFPGGTVRLSPGYFNTLQEVSTTLSAIKNITGADY